MEREGSFTRDSSVKYATSGNNDRLTRHIDGRLQSHNLNSSNHSRKTDEIGHKALKNELLSSNSPIKVGDLENRGGFKNKNIPMKLKPSIGRKPSKNGATFYSQRVDKDASFIANKEFVGEKYCSIVSKKSNESLLTHIQQPLGKTPKHLMASGAQLQGSVEKRSLNSDVREPHYNQTSENASIFSLPSKSQSSSEVSSSTSPKDDIEATYEENFEDAFLQVPGLANTTSMLDFINDIRGSDTGNDIDHDVIQRSKVWEERHMTRTHRKMLDMKSLNNGENEKRHMCDDEKSVNSLLAGRSMGYAVKIQHESIVSQWTQIRLRFSSRSELGTDKNSATCRAGILGSIQRLEKSEKNSESEGSGEKITKENVDAHLYRMWHG